MNALTETILYTKFTLAKVFSITNVKALGIIIYVVYSFALDINQGDSYVALLALILLDFVTGIYAAKKCGEAIRSSKIRHSAVKVFAYFSVIAGAHMAEKGLFSYVAFLDETVLAFFLFTELISLIENTGKMGYETPKKILNQIKEYKERI